MSSNAPRQESDPPEPAAGAGAGERRQITIRRAPKFVPFLLLGGLLGLIAAGVIAFSGPGDGDFSRSTVLGFFSMVLLVPGLLVGALAALALDWFSVRRSERAYVEPAPEDRADDERAEQPPSTEHPTDEHPMDERRAG